jgi:hypothetical protein
MRPGCGTPRIALFASHSRQRRCSSFSRRTWGRSKCPRAPRHSLPSCADTVPCPPRFRRATGTSCAKRPAPPACRHPRRPAPDLTAAGPSARHRRPGSAHGNFRPDLATGLDFPDCAGRNVAGLEARTRPFARSAAGRPPGRR